MGEKKFHLIYLISVLCLLGACSRNFEQTTDYFYQYQIYDLVYDHALYVGVCLTIEDDKNHPQNIVYEVDEIKEYYEKYGIEVLINEYCEWYYEQINPTEWTLRLTKRNVLWNVTAERYIIYLALRNNYIVYVDDESGYISFAK